VCRYLFYAAENVVGKTARAATVFAAALERDRHADELKLVRDQSLRRTAWLLPLIFVFAIVVVVLLAYNQLCQSFRSSLDRFADLI